MFNKTLMDKMKEHALTIVLVTAAFMIIVKAVTMGQGMEQRFAGMGNGAADSTAGRLGAS